MSAAGPSQPFVSCGESAREDAGAFRLFSGLRKATRRWRSFLQRKAPATPDADTRHRGSHSFKETPRLKWNVLRELFPDDETNLNSMERSRSVDDEGPSDRERPDNDGMELTVENIKELIDSVRTAAIQKKAPDGETLIHHTIMKEAFDAADFLFEYAKKEDLAVDLQWDNGDILEHSLAQYSRASVCFVLEKMSQRFASPWETTKVLTKNLEKLLERFPDVIQKFLIEDKFCFKYGRFPVPRSVFDNTDKQPIAFVRRHEQSDTFKWKAETQEDTQRFWKENCSDLAEKFKSKSEEEEVTAVSKFVTIEDAFVAGRNKSIADLTAANCSVDIFKCEAIKTNVQWKWYSTLQRKFIICNCLHLFAVLLFLVFAAQFGEIAAPDATWDLADATGDSRKRDRIIARVSVSVSLGLVIVTLVTLPTSYVWVSIIGLMTEGFLLVFSFIHNRHSNWSVFVVSVHCLVALFKSLQYLRPFRWFGPFMTMVVRVLRDILPFLIMGALTVTTFGAGLFVLMGRSYQFHDTGKSETGNVTDSHPVANEEVSEKYLDTMTEQYKHNFRTIWRCFEFLLYTIVGNIETDAFHLSDGRFLSAWLIIFFCAYVLLASIVLLSLLVSVLGDTFDKVMMHEEAEFIKHRAQRIAAFERMALWWKRIRSLLGLSNDAVTSSDPKQKYTYQKRKLKFDGSGSGLWVFHFLVPEEKAVARSKTPWHGRVHAVAQKTKELIDEKVEKEKEAREVLDTHVKNLEAKMKTIDEKIDQRINGMEEKLKEMQSQISEILQRLRND